MKKSIFALAGFLIASSLPLSASAILVDGSYHEFAFGTAGTFATTCGGSCSATSNPLAEQTSTAPWTFTGPASIFAIDLFVTGDEFNIFDNSVLIGTTSLVPIGGANPCNGDIACAIGNAAYSRGAVSVGGGAHSITIQILRNASGTTGGAAVFSVSATPEPVTATLVGVGLLAFGAFKRFRKPVL